jgi:hypothetical protein
MIGRILDWIFNTPHGDGCQVSRWRGMGLMLRYHLLDEDREDYLSEYVGRGTRTLPLRVWRRKERGFRRWTITPDQQLAEFIEEEL